MIKINSQQNLDVLLALPNWSDAFLREWYLLSPSYVNSNQQTIAWESAPTMFILIGSPDLECPGIELIFEAVDEISFSCTTDLNPIASFKNDHISFSFNGDEITSIESKFLYYRILKNECWGWKTKYGNKNIFDESGFLVFENL